MNLIVKFLLVIFTLSCTLSCVKQEYNLNKGVDTSIDINGSLKLPIGSSELITLNELLHTDESSSLKIDDQGRYFFEIDEMDNPIGVSYKIDPIGFNEASKDFTIELNNIMQQLCDLGLKQGDPIGEEYKNLIFKGEVPFENVLNLKFSVPKELINIKKVSVNTSLYFSIKSTKTITYYIEQGTKFQLPSYLKISKHNPNESCWEIRNNNQIMITQDIRMSNTNQFTFEIDITEIDFSEVGEIQDGYLSFSIPLLGEISYQFKASDYQQVIEKTELRLQYSIGDTDFNTIELKMDLNNAEDFVFEPQDFYLYEQLPDIFKNEDVKLDLYNPYIQLKTHSTLPFDLGMGMKLNAKNEAGEVTESVSIENDKIVFKSGENTDYYISKHGGVAPDGATDVIADFNSLIKNLPYKISLEDISLKGTDEYFTLNADDTLSASLSYSINIPLSLGKDFKFVYDYTLNGLDISSLVQNPTFNIALSELELKMDIENSIGMGLEITAKAIDKAGQSISDSEIEIVGGVNVNAAAAGQTSTGPGSIKISFKTSEAVDKFGGLILTIIGKGSAEAEGNQLSSSQGFRFKNMSINLKSGK